MYKRQVEHTRKTDQVILCTRLGKKKLYAAKTLAGLTVGVGFTLLLSLLMFGIIAFLYGFDGYDTILQFVLLRPFNLTVGQAALILVGLSFAGAALISIFTMMLSEVTKNSIATIGIITGVLLVTMFIMEMPANLKLLSEIWYLLPSNLVSLNGAFRYSMSVSYTHLDVYKRQGWQIPVIHPFQCFRMRGAAKRQEETAFRNSFGLPTDPFPTLLASDVTPFAFWYEGDPEGGCIRFLTETESERLMGLPEGWTKYGADGVEIRPLQRYKALGNAIALPCADYIMAGIYEVLADRAGKEE